MFYENFFNVSWIDVDTTGNDHVLHAIHQMQEAFIIGETQVAARDFEGRTSVYKLTFESTIGIACHRKQVLMPLVACTTFPQRVSVAC